MSVITMSGGRNMEIKNNTDIEKTNMENYKVILVDDEEEVIDAIKSRILWEQLGLQIVGSATNGVKALELVEKLQPDIVITDIKMPYMNGLELPTICKPNCSHNIRLFIASITSSSSSTKITL